MISRLAVDLAHRGKGLGQLLGGVARIPRSGVLRGQWISDFLIRTRAEVSAGGEIGDCVRRELSKHRSLAGYGRPVSNRKDERLEPILGLAGSLGLADGPHVRLAHDIERFLPIDDNL